MHSTHAARLGDRSSPTPCAGLYGRIAVSPATTLRWLLLASLALLLCNLVVQVSHHMLGHPNLRGFAAAFDLNGEGNVPALFAALLLVTATVLLALIASLTQQRGAPFARHWQALAVIFAYLAVDEAAQLHEKIGFNVAQLIDTRGVPAFYVWVLPFGVLVALFGVIYLPFVRALAPRLRLIVIGSGSMYVGAALGLEVVDAAYTRVFGFANLTHALIYSLEEVAEMWGIIFFIYGLLCFLREERAQLEARFSE